jgi:hypothetical protein
VLMPSCGFRAGSGIDPSGDGRTQGSTPRKSVMPALALCFGFALVAATGVFYFAAELSSQGASWAVSLCHQAPSLCVSSQPLAFAAAVMFVAYLVMERLSR